MRTKNGLFGVALLFAAISANAELDMQCYSACMGRGGMQPYACQSSCTRQDTPIVVPSIKPFDSEYKPSGALGAIYSGIRTAQEERIRAQQARQLELQNAILEQQLENQRRQSDQRSSPSRQTGTPPIPQDFGEQFSASRSRSGGSATDGASCASSSDCKADSGCIFGRCKRSSEVESQRQQSEQRGSPPQSASMPPVPRYIDEQYSTSWSRSGGAATDAYSSNPGKTNLELKKTDVGDSGGADAQASYIQGRKLWLGEGVTQNRKEAIRHFERSANLGFMQSIEMMVLVLWDGLDMSSDKFRALTYARKGAALGGATSQFSLGLAYLNGYGGVAADHKQAFKWMHRAAEMGHKQAKGFVGVMYLNGHGTTKNYDEAIKLLSDGEFKSQSAKDFLLGRAYIESGVFGKSLEKVNKGLELTQKAKNAGHPDAARVLAGAEKIRQLASSP